MLGEELGDGLGRRGRLEQPGRATAADAGDDVEILPSKLGEMMSDPDPAKVGRVSQAFLQMSKFDLATIERAYRGE